MYNLSIFKIQFLFYLYYVKQKCHEYWPESGEENFDDFTVCFVSTEGDEALVKRTFLMRNEKVFIFSIKMFYLFILSY